MGPPIYREAKGYIQQFQAPTQNESNYCTKTATSCLVRYPYKHRAETPQARGAHRARTKVVDLTNTIDPHDVHILSGVRTCSKTIITAIINKR